jgi:hypothetical protein
MQTWLQRFNWFDDTVANLLHICNPLEYLRGARIAYILSVIVMTFSAILLFVQALYYLKLSARFPGYNAEIFLLAVRPLWWQIGALFLGFQVFVRAQLFFDYISWGGLIDQHNARKR